MNKGRTEKGFSLIELLLSIGILGAISIFAITMLGTQLDNRNNMTRVNESQHILHAAMTRIYDDVRHIYLPTKKDAVFANVSRRKVKPGLFQRAESLIFSFQGFVSMARDSGESNIAMVRYHQRKSPDGGHTTQLLRTVDTNMEQNIEGADVGSTLVLVPDLKAFKVTWWNGEDFREEWDTEQSDTRATLPKMAKIELAIFRELSEQDKAKLISGELKNEDRSSMSVEAIVYLMYARSFDQLKTKSNEYTWR